ncbi:unnamed protein product [Phytophthora lilii]|uniref:Unnamed protein product n=1 Tax=Phytophthora lilii TaxID=2077276 RepID=A0A9W6TZT0_9STRA|nr:unnamed protein product [Phytophthora lilii]
MRWHKKVLAVLPKATRIDAKCATSIPSNSSCRPLQLPDKTQSPGRRPEDTAIPVRRSDWPREIKSESHLSLVPLAIPMSAVDDVAARIRRLDEARAAKTQQLRRLQHELRYNAAAGVDEALGSGRSVARLELRVEGGRNVLFKAGFLSGQRAYVRATVEVGLGPTLVEHKSTAKRPVSYTPKWSEVLLFEGLPAAVGTITLDVMQEERIGADELVGSVVLPLARLQDQRPLHKWHALRKKEKDTISEIFYFGVGAGVGVAAESSERAAFVPGTTPESGRVADARAEELDDGDEAVARQGSRAGGYAGTDGVHQRVMDTDKQVNSLSDRIANWLLPAATPTASQAAAQAEPGPQPGGETAGLASSQFFPFKQRQAAPGPRRQRRTSRPLSATPQKTPSALLAIEKWLFTDKDGNPRELPFGRQAPSY